jgi:hypothetical protein
MMIVIDVDMEMDQEVLDKHSHITISSGMSAPSSNSDGSEYQADTVEVQVFEDRKRSKGGRAKVGIKKKSAAQRHLEL